MSEGMEILDNYGFSFEAEEPYIADKAICIPKDISQQYKFELESLENVVYKTTYKNENGDYDKMVLSPFQMSELEKAVWNLGPLKISIATGPRFRFYSGGLYEDQATCLK